MGPASRSRGGGGGDWRETKAGDNWVSVGKLAKCLSLATKVDIEKILLFYEVRLLHKPFAKSPTRCLVDVAC